jgi:hypothetical protein
MAKLQELGLTNEQVGQALDYNSMPDQMGSFTPPPQPGSYRFKLPNDLTGIWEVFDHTGGNPPGKRIRAKFDDAHPLTIIQSPNATRNGEPFQTSLSNAERRRGKKDDPAAPWISDMDYFNRDVWSLTSKPSGGNVGYANEFMKHANGEFGADVEWNWFCNPKKNIYADNGQGATQEVAGQAGCGTSYYQKDVPKVAQDPNDPNSPQEFPLRITCQCGANIRAFANITRFRA